MGDVLCLLFYLEKASLRYSDCLAGNDISPDPDLTYWISQILIRRVEFKD